jgi:hypothetical protein
MLQQEILLMDNFTQFSYLRLVLASFLLESSYHCSGLLQRLSGVLHFFNSVQIDLVSIEYTFSHHPSVGVVQGFGETNWGDEIRTVMRVALSWKKSFTFDTGYSVSLRYRNHLGCRADYLVRVLPTKSFERFESSFLHSVSQVPFLCLTLPLFPSRIGRAHENLHLHLSWPHVSSTLGKKCTQSPSGCPTKVQEIHPPRGSSLESMLPHLPTQIQYCPSGHNDKVRTR